VSEPLDRSARAGEPVADAAADDREPPPLLGRWRYWYALVIGALVVEITLLAWLDRIAR